MVPQQPGTPASHRKVVASLLLQDALQHGAMLLAGPSVLGSNG